MKPPPAPEKFRLTAFGLPEPGGDRVWVVVGGAGGGRRGAVGAGIVPPSPSMTAAMVRIAHLEGCGTGTTLSVGTRGPVAWGPCRCRTG